MKLSLQWLSEIVTWTEKDSHAIMDRLTLSSAEVEGMEMQGELLQQCCVGKILKISQHPNAERLKLVNVETDKGEKRVVCGGTNLYDGMLVAFAHVGATVQHGAERMTLAPITIRGEMSNGMLCAAEELNLSDRFPSTPEEGPRPIIDLTPLELKVGQDLREALELTDTVLDVNNTAITNRPDLFSHRGFAYECVATGLAKWKTEAKTKKITFPKTALPFGLKTPAKKALPYYIGCAIDIDALGETPEWMKLHLAAVGIRSISLPVDITNFIMVEYGAPLHCFDREDIRGDILLRETDKGESITTLDGVTRKLPEGALVLSDDEGIFDLVSVMGGSRTSMKDGSRKLYLQAPVPEPTMIRRTIVATGHRTDAATIFEKGVPPVNAEAGFMRALELFLELVPGAKISSKCETWGTTELKRTIAVGIDRIESLLGISIPEKTILKTLEDLGYDVKKKAKELSVHVPAWRAKDVTREEDIIDDIGRIYGYEKLTPTMPLAPMGIPHRDNRTNRMRAMLAGQGFAEILPLSLLGPADLKKSGFDAAQCRELQSPLTEELSLLQPSTLPGLLEHAERSILQKTETLKTFRCCTVFDLKGEHTEFGILYACRTKPTLLTDPLLSLKRTLTEAFGSLGYTLSVTAAAEPAQWAHPGRHADIWLAGAHDSQSRIGTIADVHPDVRKKFGLAERSACALLNWTALLALVPKRHDQTAQIAAFPAITYDITVERTHNDALADLFAKTEKSDPLLESMVVQDLYQDPKKTDSYKLTLRFTYRAADRTLTEDEAKKAHELVLQKGNLSPL